MKRLIIDLDGTLTVDNKALAYPEKAPNPDVAEQVRKYKAAGFEIIIATSRNMQTYQASVGKLNAFTLPTIVEWLRRHGIPYDEIHVGKPWCGHDGFYVDDRAIRPSEFRELEYTEIVALLEREKDPIVP